MGQEGAAVCEKALTCLSESVLAQIGQLFLLSQGTAGYTSLAVTGEVGEPASIWVLTLHLGVKDESTEGSRDGEWSWDTLKVHTDHRGQKEL